MTESSAFINVAASRMYSIAVPLIAHVSAQLHLSTARVYTKMWHNVNHMANQMHCLYLDAEHRETSEDAVGEDGLNALLHSRDVLLGHGSSLYSMIMMRDKARISIERFATGSSHDRAADVT